MPLHDDMIDGEFDGQSPEVAHVAVDPELHDHGSPSWLIVDDDQPDGMFDGFTPPQSTLPGTGGSGAQGAQGAQGTPGPQGGVGSQGAAGAQGSAGSQGTQGPQGQQGSQGNQGNQGTSGSPIPRLNSQTSFSATPTWTTTNIDMVVVTAQANAITNWSTNLSGSPSDGQDLVIRIYDNGTARAMTWGSSFAGALLPTTTIVGYTTYIRFKYNNALSVWQCIGVSNV